MAGEKKASGGFEAAVPRNPRDAAERGDREVPIETLRARLLERRREIFTRAARAEDDLRWLDTDVESEVEERGQEENISRLLARLVDAEKAEIEAIDRALLRIVKGDYGRCESCGNRIALARLVAMPHADRCLACAASRAPVLEHERARAGRSAGR